MVAFALNHATVARASYVELLNIAAALGCIGVEVRNDLPQPLFDGEDAAAAGNMARERGLRILTVAELKRFDAWNGNRPAEALALIRTAAAAGAEAVSLIPGNDGKAPPGPEYVAGLHAALGGLQPMLEDHGLIGLIEPLGFETCRLRSKEIAVDAIRSRDASATFRIVHDTFHHQLAGDGPIFPEDSGMLHISGVSIPDVPISAMEDGHRILVDGDDRLGNIRQIDEMRSSGYRGPVSFEAFAKSVHHSEDPVRDLRVSMQFVAEQLKPNPA